MHLELPVGINLHTNLRLGKFDSGVVELEVLCGVHKLQETWDGKRELVKEVNAEFFEARGGDPMSKSFQVSTNTSELEIAKVWKGDRCSNRHVRELHFYITVGDSEVKFDRDRLQLGHK